MEAQSQISYRPILALCALLLTLGLAAAAPASPAQKWTDPCNSSFTGSSSTANLNLTEVLHSLMTRAGEIQTAAQMGKDHLTRGNNSRVPPAMATRLEAKESHVDNFPHNYTADTEKTEEEQMWGAYDFLSKVYIYHKQMLTNSLACDNEQDRDAMIAKIQNVMHSTLLTLCSVDTYLEATGHPVPASYVPANMSEVVDPDYHDLGLCSNENFRYPADFIIFKDTISTCATLREQFAVFYVDSL